MKKRAMIYIFLFFAVSLAFVSAQDIQTLGGSDGYAPGTEIQLLQICANCTFVNITSIKLGNGSLISFNDEMTKDGTTYNYTLSSTLTTSLGEYIVNWCADSDGVFDCGSYNLFVRNNATLLTTAESILYVILLILSLFLFTVFLYFGIVLPYSDEKLQDGTVRRWIPAKYLKLFSLWIGYGLLLWFLNLLTGVSNNFISLSFATNIVTNLYLFILVLSWPVTILVLSVLLIQFYWDFFIPMFKWILKKNARRKK